MLFIEFFCAIIQRNGDWGLGIGDWGLANPQSPIPNPQSPCIKAFIIKSYLHKLIQKIENKNSKVSSIPFRMSIKVDF